MALPVGFLPFDPKRDNKDSDDEEEEEEEEEELSPESDEESSGDNPHETMSNGHGQKQTRHIGGGVLLVSWLLDYLEKNFLFVKSRNEITILGFGKWMYSRGNVSCTYEENYE